MLEAFVCSHPQSHRSIPHTNTHRAHTGFSTAPSADACLDAAAATVAITIDHRGNDDGSQQQQPDAAVYSPFTGLWRLGRYAALLIPLQAAADAAVNAAEEGVAFECPQLYIPPELGLDATTTPPSVLLAGMWGLLDAHARPLLPHREVIEHVWLHGRGEAPAEVSEGGMGEENAMVALSVRVLSERLGEAALKVDSARAKRRQRQQCQGREALARAALRRWRATAAAAAAKQQEQQASPAVLVAWA